MAPPQKTNGLAIASLVLGIVSMCGIGSILAIIFSVRAKKQIRASYGTQSGEGLATAGLVLGIVQLAVVPLLVAIAIPTFLGANASAQDRAAQEDARNGLTNADTIYANQQTYAGINARMLSEVDPTLNWIDAPRTPSNGTRTVGVSSGSQGISLIASSQTGTCWMIWQTDSGPTVYGRDTDGCSAADYSIPSVGQGSSGAESWGLHGFPA